MTENLDPLRQKPDFEAKAIEPEAMTIIQVVKETGEVPTKFTTEDGYFQRFVEQTKEGLFKCSFWKVENGKRIYEAEAKYGKRPEEAIEAMKNSILQQP